MDCRGAASEAVDQRQLNQRPAVATELEAIGETVVDSIDRDDEIFAIRNLAKVLHWSGKFAEAIPRARDALRLAPNDPESRYIVASCWPISDEPRMLWRIRSLVCRWCWLSGAYLPFGELLAASGEFEQAKAYLLLAILRNPDSSAAYVSLGKVHQALGEDKFATEAFETAKKLQAR